MSAKGMTATVLTTELVAASSVDMALYGVPHHTNVQAWINEVAAALASQPKPAPVPKVESSPTAGMTLGQRILHVGGRNNAAGYVEFGSTQAVGALVRQVLRDLPKPEPIPEHELVTMYAEMPRSDSEMIEFARAIESAVLRKNGWGV